MKTNYEDVALLYADAGMDLSLEYASLRTRIGVSPPATCQQIAEHHHPVHRAIINQRGRLGLEGDDDHPPIRSNSPLGCLILEERSRYNFWAGGKRVFEVSPALTAALLTAQGSGLCIGESTWAHFLFYPLCDIFVIPNNSSSHIPINGCYVSVTYDNLDSSWSTPPDFDHKWLCLEWVSCLYEDESSGGETNWRSVSHIPLAELQEFSLDEVADKFCEANSTADWKGVSVLNQLALATLAYLQADNADSVDANRALRGVATSPAQRVESKHTRLPCVLLGQGEGAADYVKSVKSGSLLHPEAVVLLPAQIRTLKWTSPQYLTPFC